MKGQIYLFKVSLEKGIYCIIELKGSSSLYKFAEAIINAFDFELDHAFGFYNNIKYIHKSSEVYTLFCDYGTSIELHEKSVEKSYIYKVFEPGKKMLFLFDYGDDWRFLVECLDVVKPEAKKKYPNIVERQGKAPSQYLDCED